MQLDRIRIQSKSPYSLRLPEITDQKIPNTDTFYAVTGPYPTHIAISEDIQTNKIDIIKSIIKQSSDDPKHNFSKQKNNKELKSVFFKSYQLNRWYGAQQRFSISSIVKFVVEMVNQNILFQKILVVCFNFITA